MQVKVLKPFFLIPLLIAIVSLACSVDLGNKLSNVSTQPAVTVTDTEPIQTEKTQQSPLNPDGGIQSGQPDKKRFFTEDFDEDLSDWTYFLTGGQKDYLGLEIIDGYLVFDLPAKNLWVYAMYTPYVYTNVRVEVRADNRGSNDNNINMICRYDEKNGWYEVDISNGGLYSIKYGKWDNNMTTASYDKIVDGGSKNVKAGKEINNYTFVCKERTLILFINGKEAKRVDDKDHALRSGQIGFGVSSFKDPSVHVEYDWIKVSEP